MVWLGVLRLFRVPYRYLDGKSRLISVKGESYQSTSAEYSTKSNYKNISRLKERHRLIAEGQIPPVTYEWEKERWAKRARFGKYGIASGISVGELWPTIQEIEDEYRVNLYEKYVDVQKKSEMAKAEAEGKKKTRLEELAKNEANYPKRLEEYNQSLLTVEVEKSESEKRLEQRTLEIQEYFGYWIDPKDPRFQVMLAQKEAEEKKAKRLAKKKEAERKKYATVLDATEVGSK